MTTEQSLPTLEASLEEIARLIEHMEKGELSLEQSLEHFERGTVLIKHCQKTLEKAQQKVEILVQNQGQHELASYEQPTEKE